MVRSLNRSEVADVAATTLAKYVDNILAHPGEPKYYRIKEANKAFQERVVAAVGGVRFVRALGFELATQPVSDDADAATASYYCFPLDGNLEVLRDAAELLRTTVAQPKTAFDRPMTVTRAGSAGSAAAAAASFDLPASFYQVTVDDVRRQLEEMQLRAEQAATLRTKAMREADELTCKRTYRYCYVRVRFPDGFLLQATFHVREKVAALLTMVQERLRLPAPFSLVVHPEQRRLDDPALSLEDAKLVPATVVNFSFLHDEDTHALNGAPFLDDPTVALAQQQQ